MKHIQNLGFLKMFVLSYLSSKDVPKGAVSPWHFSSHFSPFSKDGKLAFLAFNVLDTRAARRLALAKDFDVCRRIWVSENGGKPLKTQWFC